MKMGKKCDTIGNILGMSLGTFGGNTMGTF
jgi:hypothetical protein